MKRLFTLAIIAMIASLSFAQAPAQVKKAAPKAKVEKVMKTADMQKAMQMKAAKQAKAQAADVQSTSVLRRAAKPSAFSVPTPKMRVKPMGRTGNHPKTVAKTGTGTIDVECIGYHAEYYASDGDWYITLTDAEQNVFCFDIYAEELEYGHTYTLDDMDTYYTAAYIGNDELPATAAEFALTLVEGDLNHVEATMTTEVGIFNLTYTESPTVNYTYGEWSDFAPKGSTDGTYTFNVMLQSGTAPLSVENVQVRTANEDENVKQVKIPNWGAGFLSNDGVDFIIDWNSETNKCSVAAQASGYMYSNTYDVIVSDISAWQGIDYSAEFPCTYDPETATFSLCLAYQVPGVGTFGYSGDSKGNLPETLVMKDGNKEEPTITTLTAELPYANTFDTEAEQDEAAIYDANEDDKTFTFVNDTKIGSIAARYSYNTSSAADDYVVFPGLTLEAGKNYKLSVDVRSQSSFYPERVEIVAGTVAKASQLTIPVIPAVVPGEDYETLTVDFTPEADGVYYFAAHAISDADCYYLWVDNFSVKENNPNTPQIVTDVTVTPDENAALKAEINFTAPAVNIAGEPIEGNVQVKISRNGEVVETVTVAAGKESSYVDDKITVPGTYTWSLVAIANDLESDAVTAKAYVGEDIPDYVENLTGKDLDNKVALTWDAPADGVNGGVVLPENLTYNVYPVEIVEWFGMVFPDIDYYNPYALGLTETKAEIEFDTNEGTQAYTYFGVTAENAAGESDGAMAAVLTGAPYELPFVESLPAGKLSYWWGVDYDDNIYEADGGLGVGQNEDGTGNFTFVAPVAGWIELYSGKIALNGATSPLLKFNTTGNGNLIVTAYGPKKEVTFSTVSASKGAVQLPLLTLGNEPWIRITIRAEFDEAGEAYVSNFSVLDNIQKDLEISVSAPSTVVAGKSATVKATVKNLGQSKASNYDVKFYINDNEAAAPMFEILPLSFTETAVYEYELETSVFDEAGEVTVKAEVIYAGDVKEVNNADETLVEIVEPTATPVAEISAESTEEGIVVNWTVAENAAQEVTEDFESYEVGITKGGETMGPWSAVDGDNGSTYGWSSSSILWDYTGEPYAFAIMNFPQVFGAASDIEATSGEQALMFMSNADVQNDDWFISPELPGIAQTISFKARPMTMNYGAETLEVMASEDGQTWTKVATFDLDNEYAFDDYSADLAEGTKYFALHYVSDDIFCAFVDDLKYIVSGGVPTAFNIYLDEVLEATVAADQTTYTIAEASDGAHEVAVTAVYGANESAPKFAIVDVSTGIQNVNANNAEAEIYTADGVRVAKANKPGVYVINGSKVVVK